MSQTVSLQYSQIPPQQNALNQDRFEGKGKGAPITGHEGPEGE
jgi:hypothetical protein